MFKLASFIVKGRRVFALIFIALMVFSAFSFSWVNVEEDIYAYLDENSDTKQGLRVMDAEFKSYAQTTILVRDIKEPQAETIRDDMEALEGVCYVTCDTACHEGQNDAVYTVIYSGVRGDESVDKGSENVHKLLDGLDYTFVSQGFENFADTLVKEMIGVLGLVVIIVFAVLLLTSTTYAEIAVLIITFVAAAVINMGTNFILGTISFVSNAVAVVLQLALSVDYAIIFCNRYKEEHTARGIEEAVTYALAYSIPAISASSLTTVAGLAAMTFMQFSLGRDMGIALIKSIFVSLLTVFLFMPALLMAFGRSMDKTAHRSFVPKIDLVGRFAYKTRIIVPLLFVGVLAAAYSGYSSVQYDFDDSRVKVFNESEERRAEMEITEKFGDSSMIVLIVPTKDYTSEAEFTREIEAMPQVKSVLGIANIDARDGYKLSDYITYADFMELADVDETMAKALFAYYAADAGEAEKATADLENYSASLIDVFVELHEIANSGKIELEQEQLELVNDLYAQLTMALDQLKGENYSCMIVYLNLHVEGEETFAFISELMDMAKARYGEDIYVTGNPVAAKDFSVTFPQDTRTVTILSILMVMAILLITFRSLFLPILLIMVIQGSIWLNFAIASWSGSYVFFMCALIVTAIQMGANIDYAIVISTRYTEMREAGLDRREAIIKTVNLAFPTVITSGTMMVVAGLLIGFRISEPIVSGMGYYVGTGTIITIILVNFVLPQLLVLGDRAVSATTLRLKPGRNYRRMLRAAAAAGLSAAILMTALMTVDFTTAAEREKSARKKEAATLTKTVRELWRLNDEVEADGLDDVKYSFAEAAVTEDIGGKQLSEGEAEYESGKAQLDDAKRQVAEGEAQYSAGLQEYESKLALYEAGKAQLEAGQAEYDAGVAQLEAAKQQLAEGEAQLSMIEPIYNAVMPLYYAYQNSQALYNDAVARGDKLAMSLLYAPLAADKAVFENTLLGTGYSLSGIISEYESGKAQADEGRAQIADAEAQLAAAKAQIDDGNAQLKDAEAQLADGKAQLEDAKSQIDSAHGQISDGEEQLKEAEEQLNDGREQLEENSRTLKKSLAALNDYSDNTEKLKAGIRSLLSIRDISDKVSDRSDRAQVFSAAEEYIKETLSSADKTAMLKSYAVIALHTAAAAALAAMAVTLFNKHRAAAVLAAVGSVCALASVILLAICAAGGRMLALALLILIFSAVFAAAGGDV